jgi:hypothetical protein
MDGTLDVERIVYVELVQIKQEQLIIVTRCHE